MPRCGVWKLGILPDSVGGLLACRSLIRQTGCLSAETAWKAIFQLTREDLRALNLL
jgi:hypothetical protein